MNSAAETKKIEHHLTFKLAGEQYAISIERVREIIEYDSVRPVPGTPEHIRGVINLRGAVVPVIDIALKFGLKETPITKDTCIVILDVMIEAEQGAMGVMTEAVSEVLELADDDIEAPPTFGTQVHVDYLLGMSMVDGRMALVLDIDQVLQSSEIELAIGRGGEEDGESAEAIDDSAGEGAGADQEHDAIGTGPGGAGLSEMEPDDAHAREEPVAEAEPTSNHAEEVTGPQEGQEEKAE